MGAALPNRAFHIVKYLNEQKKSALKIKLSEPTLSMLHCAGWTTAVPEQEQKG